MKTITSSRKGLGQLPPASPLSCDLYLTHQYSVTTALALDFKFYLKQTAAYIVLLLLCTLPSIVHSYDPYASHCSASYGTGPEYGGLGLLLSGWRTRMFPDGDRCPGGNYSSLMYQVALSSAPSCNQGQNCVEGPSHSSGTVFQGVLKINWNRHVVNNRDIVGHNGNAQLIEVHLSCLDASYILFRPSATTLPSCVIGNCPEGYERTDAGTCVVIKPGPIQSAAAPRKQDAPCP